MVGRREAGCESMSARMISVKVGLVSGTEDLGWVDVTGHKGSRLRRGVLDCIEELGRIAWGREDDVTGSKGGEGSCESCDRVSVADIISRERWRF